MKKFNTILLIDDDEINGFYTQHNLQKLGIVDNIEMAYNGQEGLEKVESICRSGCIIDIILLDINMPVMNGFEFLEHYQPLWEKNNWKTVVSIMTSSSHAIDMEQANTFSCVKHYIEKSVIQEKLRLILEEMSPT